MDTQTLIVVVLAGLAAVAGIVVAFPSIFVESQGQKRQAAIVGGAGRRTTADRTALDQATRRKQVADSLKEIENRAKSKKLTLEARIGQAGLDWTRQKFFTIAAALAIGPALLVFLLNGSVIAAALLVFVGGFGLPRWLLGFLKNRRLKRFRLAFPDALDIIIRGVKAGLPLGDCLRIIASESPEPIRSEFRQIVQGQTIGLPVSEAVEKMSERVPIPEANFFAIVIAIQQKAGGNLSEALGNLSRVLRDRKKMEGKIKAMSQEAKSSAMIIGALPFAVGFLVYLTSPHYIELLWTTTTGRLVMVGCLMWMSIGVGIIKKMISFDF